jgi:mono/diheme cytochrome c family protein
MRIGSVFVLMFLLGATGLARAGDDVEEMASRARGDEIYQKLCSTCHGKYGRGDGPLAPNLITPPADLTRSPLVAADTDALIARLRPEGGPDSHTPMMLGQFLTEQAGLDVVAYMRSTFPGGAGTSIAAGRDIYDTVCWTCHGLHGDGKGVYGKNLKGASPRDFTSTEFVIEGREDEVYSVIASGAAEAIHGSESMRGWGANFTPQQIHDLIAYLKTFKSDTKPVGDESSSE